jgi:ACS family glucarate transporter-like MFS transporter
MGFVGFGQVILWSAVQDAGDGAGGFVTAWVLLLGGLGTGLGPVITAHIVTVTGDWGAVRFHLIACGIAAGTFLWLAQPHRAIASGGAQKNFVA